MLNKPPKEFGRGQRHLSLLVAAGVVLPAEGDALTIKPQQSMVANRHPAHVSTKVAQYLRRSAESRLGIDYPVLPKQRSQERRELLGRFDVSLARKAEPFLSV